jgi:hypothetical protein
MNYFILRNKGILQSLIFNTLDRKLVIDQEARNNYRDLIMDYTFFLHRLSFINIDKLNIKLSKQKAFLDKLETLSQRYKSIGDEAIPEKNVEAFLINIQDHMREWIDNDYLQIETLAAETKHFSDASSKLEMSLGSGLERRKSEAVDVMINSNRNRVNF